MRYYPYNRLYRVWYNRRKTVKRLEFAQVGITHTRKHNPSKGLTAVEYDLTFAQELSKCLGFGLGWGVVMGGYMLLLSLVAKLPGWFSRS